MNCPPEYWIWMQRTLGAGVNSDNILMYFGNPQKLYEAGKSEWINSGVIGSAAAKKLTAYSPSQSYDIIKACKERGWSIITFDDERYPESLKEIYCPPVVLYLWGDVSVLRENVLISIVGTRNASEYGLSVAESLSYSLAQAGAVVVSGGALGIDSMAHRGAVEGGGKTIAFLGCGLGSSYLEQNSELRRVISQNGAVVSEFLPFSQPTKKSFPIRNRLISGISLGTVVIEAGEKSGSLITARFALEQGKDVFAVPGDVMRSSFFGTNNLIRDGARAVFSVADVLDGYTAVYGKYLKFDENYTPIAAIKNKGREIKSKDVKTENRLKRDDVKPLKEKKTKKNEETVKNSESKVQSVQKEVREPLKKTELPQYATENAKKLYESLTGEALVADEIALKSGLPIQDVLAGLTELELYGIVKGESGKRFKLNEEDMKNV